MPNARTNETTASTKQFVDTTFGKMAYAEAGEGFPTIFIHGLGQSAYFWRYQLHALSDERRCIAVDLMAHGQTEANPGQDVSFREQALMILEAMSRLGIETFDLVLNDSGGAVGQLMAVKAPDRVRSMVLTNCDVHDNWPPEALNEIRGAARAGLLADQFGKLADQPDLFRARGGIAEMAYEDPKTATDETIRVNLGPLVSSPERKAAFNRYAGLQDHSQLVVVEGDLRKLQTPCLIVWGTDDVFFPTEWAYWLKDALPNARDVIELAGAKLFFPEERPDVLNKYIHDFWSSL
jgi:pimeloyl-ACP methyl ester carboxylesterase